MERLPRTMSVLERPWHEAEVRRTRLERRERPPEVEVELLLPHAAELQVHRLGVLPIVAIINIRRGIPNKRKSSACTDYVPALCTRIFQSRGGGRLSFRTAKNRIRGDLDSRLHLAAKGGAPENVPQGIITKHLCTVRVIGCCDGDEHV